MTKDLIERYKKLGWSLVAIPAGSKAPTTFGWQTKSAPYDHWDKNPNHNVGILHGLSGTVALDIDHMPHTRMIFEGMDIDLDAILATSPRIVGRPDRGKALFKAPEGINLTTRKISWPVEGDGRKTEVIFELRAGQVQDVLPPSIHPDTGNPYTWAGPSFENLPEIPPQLLTIWQNWDSFRPQLMSICPWVKATPTPPSAPRRKIAQGEGVIDAYNASTSVTAALAAYGYKPVGKRWLSPNSTSKLPGVVVFEDGRAYSHHASDPFDAAHSFDAFDVYCQFEHMGNIGVAVKTLGESMDIKRLPEAPDEELRQGMAAAKSIMGKAAKATNGVPKHLLTIPGVLGDLVTYSTRTAIKYQPQFDVQTALAVGSTVMGRRFVTDNRNMTSLFFLNLATTGAGKEHTNTVIESALEEAGLLKLRGPNGFTSGAGVMSTMLERPCCVVVMDEFGAILESASARGNQNKKDALTLMMEAWGRQLKSLRMLGYSTHGMTPSQKKVFNGEVRNPSLTLVGMSTPSSFYNAVKAQDAASGFLNRFLIVESHMPRAMSRKPQDIDVPESVTDWMMACSESQAQSSGNLTDKGSGFPPDPVVIPFTDRTHEMLRAYEQQIINKQNALNNPALEDMLNRTREMAMRLSLIVTRSLGDDVIGEVAAQWAIDYVEYYSTKMLAALSEHLVEGETDGLRKAAAAAIVKSGGAGMKMNELIRAVPKLGNLKKYDRDGLLSMVCDDYNIERTKQKPVGRGAPSIIFRNIVMQ